MRRLTLFVLIAGGCAYAPPKMELVYQEEPPPPPLPPPPPPAPPPPPVYTGIDEGNLDRAVNPCDDFYKFACGGWLARTEIPADRSRWGSFSVLDEQNLTVLRRTLEDLAAGKGGGASGTKLGDFFAACMDEAAIEQGGLAELKAELARLDGIKRPADLGPAVARLHLGNTNALFGFGSEQDFKDATQVIGAADQAGLGLPDRDYYVKDEGNFKQVRGQYREHVQKMLELAGVPAAEAQKGAATVLAVETRLAEASLTRSDRRDPAKIYHRLELAGLKQKAPRFPWDAYLKALGFPTIQAIDVKVPDFFVAVDKLLDKGRLGELKVYLRWHLIHTSAPHLGKAFVDESFRFYGQTLNGAKEIQPRWKRCVGWTKQSLGEALAQSYVEQTFSGESKGATLAMVQGIEQAMRDNLTALPWMDEATRKEGFAKLEAIANKIGFPDKWRSYEGLTVARKSHFANYLAGQQFEARRQLAKIGKPVDRGEWFMTPDEVNAYYEPLLNEMVFPAGILQPPFYNPKARPAVNYGAIGMVMGHELTHGFDDEGRKFDAKGNLRDWWSPAINQEFERRAQCVVKQYDGYEVVEGQRLNGKLTLGENIADLGGIKLAYAALVKSRGQEAVPPPGGFTDAQLFFLGTAQAWCAKTRPENAKVRLTVDPHADPEHRVNGPLSNLPEFAAAFQCKPGQRMAPAERCTVW